MTQIRSRQPRKFPVEKNSVIRKMKNVHKLLILLSLFLLSCTASKSVDDKSGIGTKAYPYTVKTGLDLIKSEDFKSLAGKRVGVITNHTGLTKEGRHIVDLLSEAENVDLVAIFGPEHGVRGVEPDGKFVDSQTDPATGIPVYSLYASSKRPTEEMIAQIDVLLFDIQDVGARFYSYTYTMALAMEAAALNGKDFIVLDRPNPITGSKIEGPLLQPGFESFIGMVPIPIRYGMTVGELALLFKGEGWIEGADSLHLEVLKMQGWKRKLWFDQTDVPWVGPSPSMPTLATATVYPGTCLIEGTNVSEGRGSATPFELIGAPWVDGTVLTDRLNKLGLEGVVFEAVEFTPVAILPSVPYPKHKDKLCGGVKVRVVNRERFEPVKTGVSIIWFLQNLYPEEFEWTGTINRLYGSDKLKTGIDEGLALDELFREESVEMDAFSKIRSKYLLYE